MNANTLWIKLADVPLHIEIAYPAIKEMYKDYIIEPDSDDEFAYAELCRKNGFDNAAPICATQAEIEKGLSADPNLSEAEHKELIIYTKICHSLLCENVIIYHSSSVKIDGKAYLFAAPSGTGKSTHASLWRRRFGSRVTMINDDKPLLRFNEDGSIIAYGTPYGGKANIQTNTSAPVDGIVLLHQASENEIRRLTFKEAYPYVLNQCFLYWEDNASIGKTMDFAYKLAGLPVYELNCTISQEAVTLSYEALRGEKLQ